MEIDCSDERERGVPVLAPDAVVEYANKQKDQTKIFLLTLYVHFCLFPIPFFAKKMQIVNNRQELVLKSIDIYVGYPFKIIKTILKKTIFNISL